MSGWKLETIDSLAELRRRADAWDDLWLRSDVAMPTTRAALVAQWIEHFAPGRPLAILTIEHEGQLVAALPLVGPRSRWKSPIAEMPTCDWSSSAELLVDPTADVDEALDRLATQIAKLPWPLLRLDHMEIETPRWLAFRAATARAGRAAICRPQFATGLIDIDGDWAACEARWSRNHRKNLHRTARRLAELGTVEARIYRDLSPDRAETLVTAAFEVEDRGWKGQAGSSVLKTPGMLAFYIEQARQLAAWGMLELLFLEHRGFPIAFEYGHAAKGVYFSHKTGYDVAYGEFGPGQLLVYHALKAWHDETTRRPARRLVDCMGPLDPATAKWITRTVAIGRLIAPGGGKLAGPLLSAYRRASELRRRFRPTEFDGPTNLQPEHPCLPNLLSEPSSSISTG